MAMIPKYFLSKMSRYKDIGFESSSP